LLRHGVVFPRLIVLSDPHPLRVTTPRHPCRGVVHIGDDRPTEQHDVVLWDAPNDGLRIAEEVYSTHVFLCIIREEEKYHALNIGRE
jgi:hypothetical protein